MKKIGKFFENVLSAKSDISSKRFMGILGFLCILVMFFLDFFFTSENYIVSEKLLTTIEFIVIFCIGGGVIESFKGARNPLIKVKEDDTESKKS